MYHITIVATIYHYYHYYDILVLYEYMHYKLYINHGVLSEYIVHHHASSNRTDSSDAPSLQHSVFR